MAIFLKIIFLILGIDYKFLKLYLSNLIIKKNHWDVNLKVFSWRLNFFGQEPKYIIQCYDAFWMFLLVYGQELIGFEKNNDLDQMSFYWMKGKFGKKRFQR
jgi:hypothetical protein